MSDRDVDAEFADIVARWDEVESLPDEPAAAADAAIDPGAPTTPPPGVNPPLRSNTNPPPTRPFVVWRGAELPETQPEEEVPDPVELRDLSELDDEHFEPGPTAPLPPQEDLQFWGIVVGLVAGPLLLLWQVLFHTGSKWWTLGALGLIVLGFVLLVLRQPHSRDADDPDNGARV
ncbi:hypothetical protein SAMN04489867_0741 [Pedococcus dokdonensis]|uniref:DUF308 domain-containing protein n=1 Tax=Pedococcus dokdonensis TaxID=443156 RepID=A0A1H0MX68_9MICO|nr:hypothetical protein [Pedococcus dokdonensis]SDO84720.1 hypothetical protein SAMN04489867_0741 [Pedococcus dokdonensis]